MRKAKGRKKLLSKLLELGKEIILDLLIDNFDEHLMKERFKIDETLSLDFSERVIYITQNILSGNEKFLETLIRHNNGYIERNDYSFIENENLKTLFKDDKTKGLHGIGIQPEQMLLFSLTTGKRKEDIEFFKEQYLEFLKEVEKRKKETLKVAPQFAELLQGTSFEMEFQGFVQNDYKGFEKINFEELGKRYRLEYDKTRGSFKNVPSGFIAFFDNKTQEYFHKFELFQLNFGLLHGNLERINSYIEKLKVQEKEIEQIIIENQKLLKENDEIKYQNKNLKAQIFALEEGEKDKVILEQSKRINHLESKISKLEEELANVKEDEKLEVLENIETEEIPQNIRKDFTNLNVKVVGGKWNSRTKGEVEELADTKGFRIEFVKAEEVFRNSENLKNSDLIIFDTSYNSHGGYYKIKSLDVEMIHINKSSVLEIEKFIK